MPTVRLEDAGAPVTRELTIRGLLLGIAITLIFTAANVYLGLRVGLTFSTAIPAAVISMALLQRFGGVTIQENNIVQTVASSAGAMSAVIFVMPGLVMVGWWTGFPFWIAFGACAAGGVLGVMFTVPLRRALVVQSTLPYPEGVAAAEVLKVGSASRSGAKEERAGLLVLIVGGLSAAFYAVLAAAKLAAAEIAAYVRLGPASTGLGGSMSLALLGVGHLVGLTVGVAMAVGLVIAWGVATPVFTAMSGAAGSAEAVASAAWSANVRLIGAGAIGVAALWTLGKLVAPIWKGLMSALAAQKRLAAGDETLARTERDIPVKLMLGISLLTLVPVAVLVNAFLSGTTLAEHAPALIAMAIVYVVIVGFFVAAVCGYMAGLIGSSNSPVSGVAILAVLAAAAGLAALARGGAWVSDANALIAFALFVTSIIIAVAVSANDNLQDLKTGQLVDATPWKQQLALAIGCVAGSVAIPPVLDLLNHAYGFAGAPNVAAGVEPLPAPQAALISTLAKGVVTGDLDWGLLGLGGLLGAVLVAIDEGLRKTTRYALPPLAVGLAIYLPSAVTTPVVVGSVIGALYDRWCEKSRKPDAAKRLGVLLASGWIVGESLFGVALAGLIVAAGKGDPLALVSDFAGPATWIGLALFSVIAALSYRWVHGLADKAGDPHATDDTAQAAPH
jgi:putative OPT family oligopeptide transporter